MKWFVLIGYPVGFSYVFLTGNTATWATWQYVLVAFVYLLQIYYWNVQVPQQKLQNAPKCPACLGVVNRGASKCVNCGSDLTTAK
jgi:hypothetical protein